MIKTKKHLAFVALRFKQVDQQLQSSSVPDRHLTHFLGQVEITDSTKCY